MAHEVDRMPASEYLAGGVRTFFEDLFVFDRFDTLGKDLSRYPLYARLMVTDWDSSGVGSVAQ